MTWIVVFAVVVGVLGYASMVHIVKLPPTEHRGMVKLHILKVDLLVPRWLTVYLIASAIGLPLHYLFASMEQSETSWLLVVMLSMLGGAPLALSVHNMVARQTRIAAAAETAYRACANDAPAEEKSAALRAFAGVSLLPHLGPGLVVSLVVIAIVAFAGDVVWLGVALLVVAAAAAAQLLRRRAASNSTE